MRKRIKHTDQKKAWAKRKMKKKPYPIESREKLKSFLIICEGVNTEPAYFKSFPVGNARIETFGLGQSKKQLVDSVLEMLRKDPSLKERDVWVVFDLDLDGEREGDLKEDFNLAVEIARKNGLEVAYSNDAFELWFVWHYQPLEAQWLRKELYEKLSELWDCHYEKEGKALAFCRRIYRLLLEDERADQEEAIQRAANSHRQLEPLPFSEQNPCTTVYRLVLELNRCL